MYQIYNGCGVQDIPEPDKRRCRRTEKFVMEGREGRYISLTNEANALIPARYMMKNVKCMPREAAIGDCGPPWPAGCAVPAPGTEDAAPGAEVKVPGFEADEDVFFIDAIRADFMTALCSNAPALPMVFESTTCRHGSFLLILLCDSLRASAISRPLPAAKQ